MSLYINESYRNDTEEYYLGESGWYKTYTDNLGELYRGLRKEYGRACNMYRDSSDGPEKVGWVFTGRARYEDTDEPYTREVWVEVSTTEPRKVTEVHHVTNPFKKEGARS